MRYPQRVITSCLFAALAPACSVWRGIPTHGGGKRFDEEQLIVAGSIRRATADMNLTELRDKSVQLEVNAVAQNGGGNFTMPGLQNITGSFGRSFGSSDTDYASFPPPPGYYGGAQDSVVKNDASNAGYGFSYQPSMSYSSATFGTEGDLTYLISAIAMKARHAGINVVAEKPDYILYVLVDVLGLNRSRRDNLVAWDDKLVATCELTYYAVNTANHKLLFDARQTKARGLYGEESVIGFTGFHIDRSLQAEPPDTLPVDDATTTSAAPRQLAAVAHVPSRPHGLLAFPVSLFR